MKNKFNALVIIALVAIIGNLLVSCGDSNPSHTHEWGAWTQTTAATCTAAGEETRVCALDAAHKETRPAAAPYRQSNKE